MYACMHVCMYSLHKLIDMHVRRLHATANVICIILYRLQSQLIKEDEKPEAKRRCCSVTE